MHAIKKGNERSYSLNGFEKAINQLIQWLFFYRMLWVIGAFATTTILAIAAWNNSAPTDQIKNLVATLTGCSIVVGIFYAVLNYEINYYKYKQEQASLKKHSSFIIASEWHKDSVVKNLKITKKLHDRHKHLIEENRSKEFSQLLDEDEEGRSALISIFNYLECIALGIEEGVHDEQFMKKLFRNIIVSYTNDFEFYISYKRKKDKNPNIWIKFTDLALRWSNVTTIK